jgi:two-component system cell cycle response regulator
MANEERSDKTIIVNLKKEAEKPSTAEPFFVWISGRETGKAIPLKNRNLKIGREADCDLILDNPQISRFHAEIFWQGSELMIKDLGSTNGVFVNGKKVSEEHLHNGDKILIGTQMYFKLVYQDAVDQTYQQSLFKAANTDALTQLYNKRYFMESLEKEFSFSKRSHQPLSLILFDIDFFKRINDTYGHIAGDRILKLVGTILTSQTRLENIACRFGGEEFAIVLRGCSSLQARQVAERIRGTIQSQKVMSKSQEINFTISLGVATFNGKNFQTSEELLLRADELLYQAKQNGRNQTIAEAA